MRLEYVAVGFILMIVALMVVISVLAGTIPGIDFIFSKVS